MGRPRAFDEDQAIAAAAELFAAHGYEGTSVDDLVTGLGVHRGSLYKVFGSKRGLYLTALRRHIDQQVLPVAAAVAASANLCQALASASAAYDSGPGAGLLLLAAVERAPHDPEVAALAAEAFEALDRAIAEVLAVSGETPDTGPDLATALSATVLGVRLRSRAASALLPGTPTSARPVLALATRISPLPANHPSGE
ncbi:TetR/AcrR family transcriptional regulator [Streptomyces sp. A3M-1-3]|uniref:TetR/AcrR family transcriptional regulator n=1 Tax=Streptomyces sp. A3M-1-3 TaxID=2962044 RepID=UPI0020B73F57|nr:TetR/AcrR family transcriptional regulator [Streptomyces sp. A3M-1-3]MCP3819922.1 TetR/AcrR family transcriptional regulator [Streptomyces sp. A3M-1-3]